MKKIIKNKWILFVILIVAFVVLDLQVKNAPLANRGIVLGIGVDLDGREYSVTAEFLSPSNGGVQNYQKNTMLLTEKGKTLDEAFEKMNKTLGIRVSLKHTVLIVLGENIMKEGDYAPLINLLEGNSVFDDTPIVGVRGKAQEIFNAKPPMYTTVSYRISETLRSPDIEAGVIITNVKDFFRMITCECETACIPLVDVIEGGASETDNDGNKVETDSIELGEIAVLKRSGLKLVLNNGESDGLSYVISNVNEGNIFIERDGDRPPFDVIIVDTMSSKKFDKKTKTYTVDVKMWVREGNSMETDITDSSVKITESMKKAVGETVAKEIMQCFETCKAKQADVFDIAGVLYKSMGKKYKDTFGDNYLENINFNVSVKIIVK